jgi:hypothetical protein
MSERPSEIINSELFKMDEENLEKKDLKCIVYSCLKYLGQHLYVPSAKIPSETVHRNFKLASHPNKIIPPSESLYITKSSSLFATAPISSRILWNSA